MPQYPACGCHMHFVQQHWKIADLNVLKGLPCQADHLHRAALFAAVQQANAACKLQEQLSFSSNGRNSHSLYNVVYCVYLLDLKCPVDIGSSSYTAPINIICVSVKSHLLSMKCVTQKLMLLMQTPFKNSQCMRTGELVQAGGGGGFTQECDDSLCRGAASRCAAPCCGSTKPQDPLQCTGDGMLMRSHLAAKQLCKHRNMRDHLVLDWHCLTILMMPCL